jgi:hypothetical protein
MSTRELPDEAKLGAPSLRDMASVGGRTQSPTGLSTTTLGPLPVARHLVAQLKRYPRLRDLVLGYLTVQERIARYGDIMADLDNAGESPDRPFWARLSGKLDVLRGDFPGDLLREQEFEALVARFDTERGNVYTAAMAGRSPHQSAQSAEVAYSSVTAILGAAEELAVLCKGEARSLLSELSEAVNKIFADEEEEPRESAGETVRFTGSSPDEERDQLAPSVRGGLSDKPLEGSVAVPDVEGHLLKRGAT